MASWARYSSYSSRAGLPVSPVPYNPLNNISDTHALSQDHTSPENTPPIGLSFIGPRETLGSPSGRSGNEDDYDAGISWRRGSPGSYHSHGDSSSYTLRNSSLLHHKTMDIDAQALVDKRAGEIAQWHIHWLTPTLIAALYVAGFLAAVGHHLFYAQLDGKPADNQLRMIRYGTALAFFVKSTLVGTVILCYRQRIWHTFRKKAMTIRTIDALFAATEDLSQFTNMDMIRNGKLAAFMAACSWLLPIASVLSPASLTTEIRTLYDSSSCRIASLNFTHESTYDFRTKTDYPGMSLAFYNTTDLKAESPGWFDYYDQPSKNARRLAVTSAYLRKPAHDIDAPIRTCGQGWNCTYSLRFEGPGYKCEDVPNSASAGKMENAAPFNSSLLVPQGSSIYRAVVDQNDYIRPQVETGNDGVSIPKPYLPDRVGVFDSEPVLWIGHAVHTPEPNEPTTRSADAWKRSHQSKLFKCVLYHTEYAFTVAYEDMKQIVTRTSRNFTRPVVDTTLVPVTNQSGIFQAQPASNYVRPGDDPQKYKLTAAYHAMGSLYRNFLRGNITYNAGANPRTDSDISETRLINHVTHYPVENLMEEVQSVFEEMLLTLLSEPHLVIASNETVPCSKYRTVNVYVYLREGLWIGYSIAVGTTLAFIIVGAWSIYQNGVSSDTTFSRIMVTTRNPTLDRLSVGACLGGDPFPRELRETKLRFGVLIEDDVQEGPLGRVEHCTFGAVGETKGIVKGGVYAGVKRWRDRRNEGEGTKDEMEALIHDHGE